MANSAQITSYIREQPNTAEAEYNIFIKSRYFVAQRPATPDSQVTTDGYYLGRVVVPGPMADKRYSYLVSGNDFEVMRTQLYIRFVDNNTTDGADEDVRRAMYTVMTDDEADIYEDALCKLYPHRCNGNNNDNTKDSQ